MATGERSPRSAWSSPANDVSNHDSHSRSSSVKQSSVSSQVSYERRAGGSKTPERQDSRHMAAAAKVEEAIRSYAGKTGDLWAQPAQVRQGQDRHARREYPTERVPNPMPYTEAFSGPSTSMEMASRSQGSKVSSWFKRTFTRQSERTCSGVSGTSFTSAEARAPASSMQMVSLDYSPHLDGPVMESITDAEELGLRPPESAAPRDPSYGPQLQRTVTFATTPAPVTVADLIGPVPRYHARPPSVPDSKWTKVRSAVGHRGRFSLLFSRNRKGGSTVAPMSSEPKLLSVIVAAQAQARARDARATSGFSSDPSSEPTSALPSLYGPTPLSTAQDSKLGTMLARWGVRTPGPFDSRTMSRISTASSGNGGRLLGSPAAPASRRKSKASMLFGFSS